MNRREALSTVSLLVGGTVIGAEVFLSGCARPNAKQVFFLTVDDISLLDEVGETILPATPSSPGAKEAMIGTFMSSIVTDCYKESEQKIFRDGILKLDGYAKTKFIKAFMDLTPQEKHTLLLDLNEEAKNYKETRKPNDPEIHYYSMMKQLTLWGYFSSEIGATKALRHISVPGHYDSCVPLEKGQKAWS